MHLFQQTHDFFGRVAFNFATKQIINVKNKGISFFLLFELILSGLQQKTYAIDDNFVSGRLNGAFEEKVVDDIRSCANKLHKCLGKHQIRTFLQKVLCPFHKYSPYSTNIERSCPILVDLSYLWTRKNIISENHFHVLFESLLFFNGFLE